MLIFDELKKNDPQLRLVAIGLAMGFFILLAGLWWVQVASAGEYESHLQTQSYRTVRVPAMRGKILDCEGRVMAENGASYNLSLYLGDLTGQFQAEEKRLHPAKAATQSHPFWKFWARSSSNAKSASLSRDEISALRWQARCDVAYNVISKMSQTLQRPLTFDARGFERAYSSSLYEPYPICQNLSPAEVARFEENYSDHNAVDLDVLTTRLYPLGRMASSVLGYVQKDDSSMEGEEAYFNYRLPDYKGVIGIEGGFDKQLHGRAGVESVLVNNQGFRENQDIGSEPEPGNNIRLTIDLDIQRAAEESLVQHQGENSRAAIVVMNVHTGDVLAMVSSPAINPNYFTGNLPPDELQKESEMMEDTNLLPQMNRATQTFDAPGSIFKPVVGLAALEDGLNPNETYQVEEDPLNPGHGCIHIGERKIKDTVAPGTYDFKRAIAESSNSYFIFVGFHHTSIEHVIKLGEKLHFGERTGVPTGQDSRGRFPTLNRVHESDWHDGDSANIFFGQGELAVTPLQMAVAYSAIANGGTVLWPRLVDRIEPQDPSSGEAPTIEPSGIVRDHLDVSKRSLTILREAMLGETQNGTGKAACVPGFLICGKTGTAQVQNQHGDLIGHNFWFASYAPYENPKYAVVVMVQKGPGPGSGGIVCAPIAHDIYAEILKKENSMPPVVAMNVR
ncbi:MAG TPA: penicillin-binding transpeptidase domain-containing protein [Candidatus Acidoferrales bacterium]|nr:penicillin-binding transpeptidase domain-containing protein [Candidatus Acidoferrales bacterium]